MQQTINKIQRAFNKSAYQYDAATLFHRKIAEKLLQEVRLEALPARILDVGCGTGFMTGLAQHKFNGAEVIGMDFSNNMLDVARQKNEGIVWRLGDLHQLPFNDAYFDLVISNLAYQWAQDLLKAFKEAFRVLIPGKTFLTTLFGFDTCHELWVCLDEATDTAFALKRLASCHHVLTALRQAGFENPKVRNEYIQLNFDDMYGLLHWLKSIGGNNLMREGFMGPQTLATAGTIYQKRFSSIKGIDATFEVIWIDAQK